MPERVPLQLTPKDFKSDQEVRWCPGCGDYAILAAMTVVVTAAYILWTIQRVYMGTNEAYKNYPDISFRELICAVPLVILCVALGIFPFLLMNWMQWDLTGLVDSFVMVAR